MLFLVPTDDTTGSAPVLGSTGGLKVELDLDDAPFLEELKEEKPASEPAKALPPSTEDEGEGKSASGFTAKLAALFSSKKRVAVLAAGLVFLVAAPVGLNFFLSGEKSPPPQPVERVQVPESGPRHGASAPEAPLFSLAEFLVPLKGREGDLRFLRCSFAVPVPQPSLMAELRAKEIVVRDALYHYLCNRPLALLSDKEQAGMLKQDLISVINEHISSEKVEELFFHEYLILGM